MRRYRRLRQRGLPAPDAYRAAAAVPPSLRYRSGPGEAITILLDEEPDLDGYIVTAVAEPDDDPDRSWLGTFTDTPSIDTVPVNRGDRGLYQYFLPSYTIAQRRTDLSRRGYARGPAHEIALHDVHADAALTRQLDHRYLRVEVGKAGVLLGHSGLGTTFLLDRHHDLETEMAQVIEDHGLVDEAIAQARAALPPLIAALAS